MMMKLISHALFLTVFTLCAAGMTRFDCKVDSVNQSTLKIEVLDFHSTHRCATCIAIESNTRYTLDTFFNKELKEGKITFRIINVDKKENEKIAESYGAYGTALFLNVIRDGKETRIGLTNFAFLKGNDREAFSNELKSKVESELKTL
ncbi:MAG TPA: hypothetical protein DCX54_11525 [Flavobacteriales bacterium]|nr:hypothetical protein [Flavobacteriales bacterium]